MNIHTKMRAITAMAITAIAVATLSGCGAGKAASADTAKAEETISVSVINPVKKSVQGTLMLNGIIHTENEVNVVAETSGKVIKVYAETGMRVSTGDVLAQIDDELKQAAYRTATAAYDKSKSDWGRAQDLFAQKVISDSDLQGAKLSFASAESNFLIAKRDLERAKVRSPQNGIITQRFVSVGSMLSSGTPVAHVVDADNLKLTVQVSERDILKIRDGMKVGIDSDMYPGMTFSGRISAVSLKGDAALTFPVEIVLKSDTAKPLYDGMSARAHVDLGAKTILAIPRALIVGKREAPQVYIVMNGMARLVDIATGAEYDTDIEVLKGLSEADLVVSAGQNNLADGDAVSVMESIVK